jgi:pyruvate kinase
LIAKQRPDYPVYAFTPREDTYNRMAISWGITPVWVPPSKDVDEMLHRATQTLLAAGIVTAGDQIVVINGQAKETGATNMIHVHGV